MSAVTLGFALLTVGMITGGVQEFVVKAFLALPWFRLHRTGHVGPAARRICA